MVDYEKMVFFAVGVMFTGVAGLVFAQIKKLISGSEKGIVSIDAEKAREIIREEILKQQKEIDELKKDLKSTAESMLLAGDKQQARLDELVLTLLTNRGKDNND